MRRLIWRPALRGARRHVTTTAAMTVKQRGYPRLPVPPLRQTLDAYLESLKPFLEDLEISTGRPKEELLQQREGWALDFEDGLGKDCQEKLLELDSKSPYNWLDDNFWLVKAYHEDRTSLLIQSNWWLAFKQDPSFEKLEACPLQTGSDFTVEQLQRAAWLIYRLLLVREQIIREEIYPPSTGRDHWAKRPALRIFNTYRVPRTGCDYLTTSLDVSQQRILVMAKGEQFIVDARDDGGALRSPSQMYQDLYIVATTARNVDVTNSVGILNTSDRDTWAKNRKHLGSLSCSNMENLASIENCAFALALESPSDIPSSGIQYDKGSAYQSLICSARSGKTARNRWLDNGFTIIVRPDAGAGMSGEHSPCDALVPSMVADEALVVPVDISVFLQSSHTRFDKPRVQKLFWTMDSQIEFQCSQVAEEALHIIEDSNYDLLWFTEFGVSRLKELGLSSDAFIQLALQLAWRKDQGSFTAVYETALTRLFLHGRTETIRAYTTQSREFIKAMLDPLATNNTRRRLLERAIQVHNSLTKKASTGRGIDRHLLGLWLVKPTYESSPLFDDPLYSKSQSWFLSTSGLSEGPRFVGTGFGATYPHGYGINYMAAPETLRFGIECKNSCPSTSTRRFKALLTESLLELQALYLGRAAVEAHL